MKRTLLVFAGLLLLLTACDKESDSDGISGRWKMTYKTIGSMGWWKEDVSEEGITWTFKGDMLEMKDASGARKDLTAKYRLSNDTLWLWDFHMVGVDTDDEFIYPGGYLRDEYLREYGVCANGTFWFHTHYTSSTLNLTNNDFARLEFSK